MQTILLHLCNFCVKVKVLCEYLIVKVLKICNFAYVLKFSDSDKKKDIISSTQIIIVSYVVDCKKQTIHNCDSLVTLWYTVFIWQQVSYHHFLITWTLTLLGLIFFWDTTLIFFIAKKHFWKSHMTWSMTLPSLKKLVLGRLSPHFQKVIL